MEHGDNHEWEALISLLDDPDTETYREISSLISSKGFDAIAHLEEAWMHVSDGLTQQRIEEIIHTIQFNTTKSSLVSWLESGADDLFHGFFLVTRYQYPEISEDKLGEQFNRITRDVWLEYNPNQAPLEKINALNHIIFSIYNFAGDKLNPQSIENYYLNNVMESKTGNPLSLGILYLCVAQNLGLPIYGVDLPRNFVLAYTNKVLDKEVAGLDMLKELFYINPFSEGMVFTRKEMLQFLNKIHVEPEDKYFKPCNNKAILSRLIAELIYLFDQKGNTEKVEELKEILGILS